MMRAILAGCRHGLASAAVGAFALVLMGGGMPAHAGSDPSQHGGESPSHNLVADAGRLQVLASAAQASEGATAGESASGAAPAAGQASQPAAGDWKQGPQRVGSLEIELLSDAQQVAPGERFRVGLRLRHDPHWHTYWRNPGDTGLPTKFELQGPEGAVYSDMVWPAPERLAIGPLANYGYEGEVVLYRDVTLPADFRGRQARFQVNAEWLICRELCIPGEAALALDIPVGGSTRTLDVESAAFEQTRRRAPEAGQALEAGWWQRNGDATLVLPPGLAKNGPPRSALFLPYFEEVVRPVAEQRLVEINGDGEVRYGLTLSLNEQAVRSAEAGWEQKGGMLIVDGGQPVEVKLQKLGVTPIAGKTLGVDKPREVELEGQGDSGGQGSGKG
ncbi:MAG: protein-disulfide reductase DsbD family protein, partial [Lautropia sp.]|nr:protein-disulfide reductase DsbD family protein [Lautropia sp.]